MHEPARFRPGSLLVEGDEAGENVVVGEIGGPAVGISDGSVELVAQLLQDQHKAIIENAALGRLKSFKSHAHPQQLQHIIGPGQRQLWR